MRLYDFNKMRLLVSDPRRKMCMALKIADISPVSIVPREHDEIKICDSVKNLWRDPSALEDSDEWNNDLDEADEDEMLA